MMTQEEKNFLIKMLNDHMYPKDNEAKTEYNNGIQTAIRLVEAVKVEKEEFGQKLRKELAFVFCQARVPNDDEIEKHFQQCKFCQNSVKIQIKKDERIKQLIDAGEDPWPEIR